ncbi:hypothetical protein HanXRQr2_Chr07g0290551 [Helianthus annuus]|uniref:Uncharacterized protein n=1 Tax=Helianthus annuus TaxID=4232 RepID=A0A9K3IJZ8_HELAN|nr:hypothetical protein HanXRQr2_Chr07g0290551 [Helianthus annuus]KAJ0904365.1 hypothetical protein HanPSC8_Chr07g0281291 [Helianthus annuus]
MKVRVLHLWHLEVKMMFKRPLKNYITKILRCSLCSLFEYIYRQFIGNVPKTWTDDEFRKVIEEIGLGSEVSLRAYKGGIGGVGYGMPYIFAYIMINLHGKLGFRVLPGLLLCHEDFRYGEQCGSYIANQGKKRLCKKKCCCLRPYIIMHFHPYTVPLLHDP